MPAFSIADLAQWVDGEAQGPGDPSQVKLVGAASLKDATTAQFGFLANPRYLQAARASDAGCILVDNAVELGDRWVVRCVDPYRAFAKALQRVHPSAPIQPIVDPKAWVAPDAIVDGARIDAFAWVGPGATVGPGSWLQSGAVVGEGSTIGADCRLMPHSVVMENCAVGDRVWLNPGAVVGAEGFGFAPGAAGHDKIPQTGTVQIEDDVEIGANSCVDRAALGETRVASGSKLDNLVQVGHGAQIGPGALMVAYSGVAGSSRLGSGVTLAAKAAVLGHLELGDGVQVGVASVVHGDQPPGAKVTGIPAIAHRSWLKAATAFGSVPEMAREIRRLEKRIKALEAEADSEA